MKVPFLKKKLENDFVRYFDELMSSVSDSLSKHKACKESSKLFQMLHPIFVLLESLKSSEYYPQPNNILLMQEYLARGDREKVVALARKTNDFDDEAEVLRDAVQKHTFTPYFEEIYSDLLLLLNNYYFNNYRGCFICLRCVLEDLYRHLYYKDHIQEYLSLLAGIDEHSMGLRPQVFREYLQRVSFLQPFSKVDKKFETCESGYVWGWNNELYSRTSFYVHASNEEAMNRYTNNKQMKFNETYAEKVEGIAKEGVAIAVAFLIPCHVDVYSRFNDYNKSMILESFEPRMRRNFRSLLNV